jgi:manganese transport protein
VASAYFLSDKLGWGLEVKDPKFRLIIVLGCGLSVLGGFIKGSFLFLLVLMLALGLCGTPFILVLILVLQGKPPFTGAYQSSPGMKVLGWVAVGVTIFLAARFIFVHLGGSR